MDKNGYPDERELKKIADWDYQDFNGLMEYVESLWWRPDWGLRKGRKYYYLSTGGWSGNEDIIVALMKNTMFWIYCWVQSRRGGHYIFQIKNSKDALWQGCNTSQ